MENTEKIIEGVTPQIKVSLKLESLKLAFTNSKNKTEGLSLAQEMYSFLIRE
mgnify:CR=1 FL=1|tara:strand:- start:8633 stop:8788 length:156 start_codon:yes stop_codon:yes gene_type:complete